VITTNPAPGAQVPRGSKVAVVVSQGPPLIPIPDVTGKSVTEAAAILQQAGFTISGVLGDPTKEVLATDPPAGEPHPRGTPVRIIARG
jgi:serine/threonine-protein kinase